MRKDLTKHVKNLENKGITYLKNIFTKKECNKFIKLFEKLSFNFEKKYKKNLGNEGQTIQNYFAYNQKLLKLLYIKKVDEILKKVIDEDYVLINSSLTNRFKRQANSVKQDTKFHLNNIGGEWHTDSRVVGRKRLDKGFSYIVLIMFDDFTLENGCTQYIEKSHLIRNQIPNKKKKYLNYKNILGKQGTVVIFDTGLWHRAGVPSSIKSRWSVFAYYGPWFMKPYYDFPLMFKKEKKLNKYIKKLLHFNSIPPKNELERVNTLKK